MNDSMRLKVKGDTYFLQEPNNVFFRNNTGSFRMEGQSIELWIEKLMPLMDGGRTLGEMTHGLPDPHKEQLVRIVGTLLEHGFIRDVSQDPPHQLSEAVMNKYASQIEYLDNIAGSGGYRFQSYRASRVLAVGSGLPLVQLTASLLESGLPRLHVLFTEESSADRSRIEELTAHARESDGEVDVTVLPLRHRESWHDIIRPFDAVLYISGTNSDIDELSALHDACRRANIIMLPAYIHGRNGIAGPLVHPQSEGCWESARRRLHDVPLRNGNRASHSQTAAAMLANTLAFTLLKCQAGIPVANLADRLYLLDAETLEGGWHRFEPHPLASGKRPSIRWVTAWETYEASAPKETEEWFAFINRLTSPITGIFHEWDEGELRQLPLAQCRATAADPLSPGPVGLLPAIIRTGLTHEEARIQAALSGIEAYSSRLASHYLSLSAGERTVGHFALDTAEPIGIGAGRTTAEGISRGLRHLLHEQLTSRLAFEPSRMLQPESLHIRDERSLYYLRALHILGGSPVIGASEDISGFPVIGVGTGGNWFISAGLHPTLALRSALQQALERLQNGNTSPNMRRNDEVTVESMPSRQLAFAALSEDADAAVLPYALHILQQTRKRLYIGDLTAEPFLREGLAGVFGIVMRGEVTE